MNDIEQLTRDLVGFRSSHERPEELKKCLEYCVRFFDGLPLTVSRFESNSIESVLIHTGAADNLDVLLVGHIDIADGHDRLFTLEKKDGKLIGRGVVDMKAFIATSMAVLRDMVQEGSPLALGLLVVTDEELGGKDGSRFVVEEKEIRAKVVLVPDDGDDIRRVVEQTKNAFAVKFTARGKSAHGNRPWDGVNAIELLLATLENLRATFPSYPSPPETNWVNTLNLGKIEGGIASNEVPADASMTLDIRIVPPTTREEVFKALDASLVDGISYEVLVEATPTTLNKEDSLVRSYLLNIERVTGEKPLFKQSGGGTDARYFAARNMTVIVHQGTGGDAQGEGEYVELDSLTQLVDIQKGFIREMASKTPAS
ncbi:MAG: acetylornithine deacetylase [Parcubacteria bacterium C7867-001]|nr:MAG: acetylornithine deacetylase [Parcubacteria bacterium C7867-001]